MSLESLSAIPITKEDLQKALEKVAGLIKSVSWSVTPELDKNDPSYYQKKMEKKEVSISISDLINAINPEDELLSDDQLHLLRAIRSATQVAYHVSKDYLKRAGVPNKMPKGATQAQKTELNEKEQTASAIALFTMARYILWDTQSLISDNAFLENVNVQLDEVELSRIIPSLRCATFFFGRNIQSETHNDDVRFVATVYKFAELLQQEILNRSGSLKHVTHFADVTYQVDDSDFTISGFQVMMLTDEATEVNEVYPDQVIGNDSSVTGVEQDMRKVFLYDIDSQTNPISEFGGFQSVALLSGNPGNGKTLVLSVARTLGRDYAESTGLPYRDLVVPNMVSKMQGESTDFAKDYLRKLFDPKTINLGIGDEFEAVLPDHGDDKTSEGDKKATVEWLKGFSGVGSVNRYNWLFLAATNYPENIDPAFMSRIKSRKYITGAETVDDYIRFIVLNLKKLNKQYPELVNLKGVDWSMNLRASRVMNDPIKVNPMASVQDIQNQAMKMYDPNDIRYFAHFFYMMKLREQRFSLRDCANTIDGAKSHVSGFEVPLDFMNERRHYLDHPIEAKSGLISDLAAGHVASSGVNFVEMLNLKAIEYAEEALRMQETKKNRDVDEHARKMLIGHLAQEKFQKDISE